MSAAEVLVQSVQDLSTTGLTSSLPPPARRSHYHSLPPSRSPSRAQLAYPDSERSDTDGECSCDPETIQAVRHNASRRRTSASALLSGLRREEIQHILFCPGGSRSAAAAVHQRKLRSYSSSALTAMSPSNAKAANLLYPSPSSSFTPPPTLADEEERVSRVLSNAKLPGSSNASASDVAAAAPPRPSEDKENARRSLSNSAAGTSPKQTAKIASINPAKTSPPTSRRSSAGYPSSPSSHARSQKNRRSRAISQASAEHRLSGAPWQGEAGGAASPPSSPTRPSLRHVSGMGSNNDHQTEASAQPRRRISLAERRRSSGYSASSSATESPCSVHSPLPTQDHSGMHFSESTGMYADTSGAHDVDPAATPRRRSLRKSADIEGMSSSGYLDLPPVAPQLVSARSDTTLTARLQAALPAVRIRDFAFPDLDPRHVGQPAEVQPIQIPASDSGNDSPWRSGFLSAESIRGDPSAALLSSSSSSSLSSSFTPPPFGSFGFGNPYHYSSKPGGPSHQNDDSPRPGQQGWTPHWQRAGESEHDSASSRPSTSKYSWGFVTDNSTDETNHERGQENESSFSQTTELGRDGEGGPSIPMGSGLAISEFHEFDDDEEEEEIEGLEMQGSENNPNTQIPTGGLLFRAVYPFTAEAPQEMNLKEGDFVRVYEQLCDGWVVGGKVQFDPEQTEQEVETGLIPQNYIVLVGQQHRSGSDDEANEPTA